MAWLDNTRKSHEDYFEQTLCLREDECKVILPYFKKIEKEIRKKVEKYRDIHEGGEATERQQDLLCDYRRQLDSVESIISCAEELIKPKRFSAEDEFEWDLKNLKNKSYM